MASKNSGLSKWINLLSPRQWFLLFVVILIAQRFFHFGELIDSPHNWRQSDTAQYIWDFYQNGIDLFYPSVCWMGGYGTLILEFPLHEAIVALFYDAFGPSHIWARIVTLICFLLSAWWFYRIVKHLCGEGIAQISTLIYMALPLSLFYSRAVHIDYMAIAFSHGMLWNFIRGFELRSTRWLIYGSLLAIPAFLIKAPYAFYMAIPLLYWIIKHKSYRTLLLHLPLFALPIFLFVLWLAHTKTVNAAAPDWSNIIPDYHRFTDMGTWYFGTWEQRISGKSWDTLSTRFQTEVMGYLGILLTLIGCYFGRIQRGFAFAGIWFLAVVVYMLIFFNLNVYHDYYQLPFIAPTAILIAFAIKGIGEKLSGVTSKLVRGALVLFLIIESFAHAEINYYSIAEDQIAIGKAIEEHTNSEDLVIVSYGGLDSRCPVILYRARRQGWSIHHQLLSPEVCYGLYKEGATYLAIVRDTKVEGEMARFTDALGTLEVIPLDLGKKKVFLYQLTDESLSPN